MIMRSAVLALSTCLAFAQSVEQNKYILGYQIGPDAEDVMNLTRDLEAIDKILTKKTNQEELGKAWSVYVNGAYSETYAFLELDNPIEWSVPPGATLHAQANNGQQVKVIAYGDMAEGETLFKIRYKEDQATCNVGGLPSDMITTDGCLVTPGFLRVENYEKLLQFTYDDVQGNACEYTIAQQSFLASESWRVQRNPMNSYYDSFSKFVDFYGTPAFANLINEAAEQQKQFQFKNGYFDFTSADEKTNSDSFQLTTSYVVLGLSVIRELEEAVLACKGECSLTGKCDETAEAIESIDDAVAFYVGHSQEEEEEGRLLYGLANQMCKYFKTCGENGDSTEGVAKSNLDLFDLFNEMKDHLANGKCGEARRTKNKAVNLVTLPLVQGFLFSAYRRDHEDSYPEYTKEDTAPFAAAVFPMLNACGMEEAGTIEFDFAPGKEKHIREKLNKVVHAIEDYYYCMDICCADIGGLWDEDKQEYHKNSAPCVETRQECIERSNLSKKESGGEKKTAAIVILVLILLSATIVTFLFCRRRSRNNTPSSRGQNGGVDLEGRTIT